MKTLADIKSCRGLSLIELMIAMVIGLLLLGATISMFISNKRIYKEQDEMGRLQENARFALQLLIEDIRMAGYVGCANDMRKVENHLNDAGDAGEIFSFSHALEGLDNHAAGDTWKPGNYSALANTMATGTDAFAVRYLLPSGIRLSAPMPSVTAEPRVVTVGDLSAGDIIALADCNSADIMQLTQVNDDSGTLQHGIGSGEPGNASNALQKPYDTSAEVLYLVSRRYYIGENASGNRSLYRFHLAQDKGDVDGDGNSTEILEHSQELIEGVENMQILYGVDSNGNDAVADAYLDADSVDNNWPNVVSMRLALLFSTAEENTGNDLDGKRYDLLGTVTNPANDRKRRRVVNATVQIRNRGK